MVTCIHERQWRTIRSREYVCVCRRGYALLGMVIIDAMAYIALATKVRA